MEDKVTNLLGEEVDSSEMKKAMEGSPKSEVVIIKGREIPKDVYNLCVLHYLSCQYGDN